MLAKPQRRECVGRRGWAGRLAPRLKIMKMELVKMKCVVKGYDLKLEVIVGVNGANLSEAMDRAKKLFENVPHHGLKIVEMEQTDKTIQGLYEGAGFVEKCCLCKKPFRDDEPMEKMGLLGYAHEECADSWRKNPEHE